MVNNITVPEKKTNKYLKFLKQKNQFHCNKFLRIYITNHLNLTMNYSVCNANCCKHRFYLIL